MSGDQLSSSFYVTLLVNLSPVTLAQVRHETGENQAKPFRINLGSREVYTTFAVVFEAIRKAQLELMKQ